MGLLGKVSNSRDPSRLLKRYYNATNTIIIVHALVIFQRCHSAIANAAMPPVRTLLAGRNKLKDLLDKADAEIKPGGAVTAAELKTPAADSLGQTV